LPDHLEKALEQLLVASFQLWE